MDAAETEEDKAEEVALVGGRRRQAMIGEEVGTAAKIGGEEAEGGTQRRVAPAGNGQRTET